VRRSLLTRRANAPAGYRSLGCVSVAAATMASPTIEGSSPALTAAAVSASMAARRRAYSESGPSAATVFASKKVLV
jgi:hypothetical protein